MLILALDGLNFRLNILLQIRFAPHRFITNISYCIPNRHLFPLVVAYNNLMAILMY